VGHASLRAAIASGVLLACVTGARSQPLTINTLAGYPGQSYAEGAGSNARFNNPNGAALDSAGNFYIADTDNHTIRKITTGGVVSTLAGLPGVSGSADGTGASAQFNQPQGVAVDSAGNVYVADTGNHTIRRITPAGVVSTLAGLAGATGSANGTSSSARFYQPEGVAVNSATNVYVADTWNHTIRQITPAGVVSTLAGSAGSYGSADGTGGAAQFNQPQGVAVDSTGTVYVGDTGNQTIRKITPGGAVSTLAGLAGNYGSADATGTNAQFYGPAGVAVDGLGSVYVADYFNQTIRKVTPAGVVSTLAGSAGIFGSADGTNSTVRFWSPAGVAVSGTNNVTVYVADAGNGTIRTLALAGASNWVSTTLAGSASTGHSDATTGSSARFYWPGGAAVDSAGNVYVADTQNGTIRKVTAAGIVSTLAGSAGNYGSADGTGTNAQFYGPQGVAVDSAGTVYVADTVNATIRKITPGGTVSTLAGTAGSYGVLDGTGGAARFYEPQGLAVDSAYTVYVADAWNHTIRKITPAGVVSTLAGLPGNAGCTDGTGSGVGTNTARFNSPAAVAVDSGGNVYVADYVNHTIRRVTAAGVVSTLAGLPGVWGNGDGTNSDARFYQPAGIVVDSAANLYVLDSGNHTIRKLAPVGTNWVVSTLAGAAGVSGSSDGTGSNAQFDYPAGLALDGATNLYMADTANNIIRRGLSIVTGPPNITGQPQNQSASQGASATFTVIASGSAPLHYQWSFYGTNLSGANGSSYIRTNAQPADAGPYSVVVTNTLGAATSSNALLVVIVPPTITTQPQSQTVTQGTSPTFTVAASGTAPFSYQWRLGGADISGATTSSYTRSNAQLTYAGNYSVVVTNSAGSATSSNALLTVVAPPGITAQPQNQVVLQGNNASFTVTASGTGPLFYQWRWFGANLAGATGTSLSLTAVTNKQSGPYTVVVTNAYGAATSQVATLTVTTVFQAGGLSPIWSLAPGSRSYLTTSSTPNERGMAYNPLNGHLLVVSKTNPSVYVLDSATGADLNQLSVSGISGGTYALLMIGVADDGAVYAANLTTASSTTPLTLYRWANDSAGTVPTVAYSGNPTTGNSQRYGDTIDVRGAGTSTEILIGSRSSTNAVVLNTTDGATFAAKSVIVADAAAGSFGLGIAFGQANTFWGKATSVALRQVTYNLAAGTGPTIHSYANPVFPNAVAPIGVSTQLNLLAGINVGTTGNHLRLYDLSPTLTNGAPALVATNAFATDNDNSSTGTGSVDFGPYTVYALCANNGLIALQITQAAVNVPPGIAAQPQNQNVNAGQDATFGVNAYGTAPLSYQWRFNGTNIAGATASSYTRTNSQPADVGNYSVIISNMAGGVISDTAILTLTNPPPAQPGHFDGISLVPNSSLQLAMSGTPGTNYVLQYTRDWSGWTNLATLSGTDGLFQYSDPAVTNTDQRFYRLKVGP
jgi:hypothetical protein